MVMPVDPVDPSSHRPDHPSHREDNPSSSNVDRPGGPINGWLGIIPHASEKTASANFHSPVAAIADYKAALALYVSSGETDDSFVGQMATIIQSQSKRPVSLGFINEINQAFKDAGEDFNVASLSQKIFAILSV